MREIDEYFMQNEEPVKSCLESLRHFILQQNANIVEVWKYKMPFYCYKSANGSEARFCYLWVDKKRKQPYIGLVDGRLFDSSELISEKRSRMKIWLVDLNEDVDVETLRVLMKESIQLLSDKV